MKELFDSLSPILEEEQARVCDFYEIGTVKRWEINYRGLVNRTCELDEKFFLTLHGRRTHDQVEAIAQVANGVDETIPIARPLRGKNGSYALSVEAVPALLSPKLPGEHMVGIAHTEKQVLSKELHQKLAVFFWQFQKDLSAMSSSLKRRLQAQSVSNVTEIPENPPDDFSHLYDYSSGVLSPEYRYPDLIHDDMERQNILISGNDITGLVDLDSLRTGDILYEFGHFLFNFVLCDPRADLAIIDLYVNEIIISGIIKPEDIPHLYKHIFYFIISDIIEFKFLSEQPHSPQHKAIDMKLLISQYEAALSKANTFFRKTFPQSF
ncbi:phosphotransferase [Candidatus Gracilibacteria bacterium]|nr:phosphotransferase [Candidatus Gracilibacteria bacterium]